ncbi:MAG: SdpI family protein [Clostridiales bacterium]|nr:SdpI family protein [Clostridiales bacterium]
MGFWLFMLVIVLLLPGIMVLFGQVFLRRPPQQINGVYGYRTRRSMASQAAWDFAHRTCGRLWFAWGLVLLPVSAALMLPALGRAEDVVGLWGTVLVVLQLALLFLTLGLTVRALKRHFDEAGRPR